MTRALAGQCPRCGARTLFAGLTRFADRCRACGQNLSAFNVGDGPAAFLILIIGAMVVGLALAVELAAVPPFWVHILLWLPVTVIAVIGSLRFTKALMLMLEYRHSAHEGRLKGPER